MHTLSVVIPVYRSERILPDLYRQLVSALKELASDFEIIFVEDGGGDQSWSIIADLARADHRVRGMRMSRNYGQHNALLCGIRAAQNEIIVTMDDDLQHPVSEIAPMLAALTAEYDVVYGAPQTEQHGFLRDLASRLTKIALTSAMGAETARNVSAFRVFKTRLREGFRDYRSPFVSIDVLLTWTTSRFTAIKVRHEPRPAGEFGLYGPQTRSPCLQPHDRLQHAAASGRQPGRLRLYAVRFYRPGVGAGPLSLVRERGPRLRLPGLDHHDLFRSPALRSRHYWGIPRAHALSDDGPSRICDRRSVEL